MDSLLKEDNNSSDDMILYEYDGYLYECSLDIPKKTIFNILLCENDLILKNDTYEFRIIYQHIYHWEFLPHSFGFTYKNYKKTQNFSFNVKNGYIIARNLHNITKGLVSYYKNL